MIEPLPGWSQPEGSARRGVVRSAIFFTPLFIAAFAGFAAALVAVAAGNGGNLIIVLVIAGLLALLLGFQALGALLDTNAELKETTGQIRRKWRRSDFIFWKSHYIRVGGGIFKVDPVAFELLQQGQEIAILHLPRTCSVESLSLVVPPPPAAQPEGDAATTAIAETPEPAPASSPPRQRTDVVLGELFRARPGGDEASEPPPDAP